MELPDDIIISLINDIESHPVLWDAKCSEYKLGRRKSDAWQLLATKYNCTPDEVKKKWQSLLASYRRERSKEISVSGMGNNEKYISAWFAFSAMGFMTDRYKPRATKDTFQENAEDDVDEVPTTQSISVKIENEHVPFLYPKELSTKKRRNANQEDPRINEALNILKQTSTFVHERERNELAIFGEFVATKLNKFDERTCSIVQHKIHSIIFEAELGRLSDYSNANDRSFQDRNLISPHSAYGHSSESNSST